MRIFGGIVKSFLLLPFPLRIMIEWILIISLFMFVWAFFKWIPIIVLRVFRILNKFATMVNRQLICAVGKKHKNVYDWDEKIGRLGRTIDTRLSNRVDWLKGSKWRQILKKCFGILVIVYLFAILPIFPLKEVVNEYYLDQLYCINKVFVSLEKVLGEASADYPPILNWKKPERDSAETVAVEQPDAEIVEKQVIIQLNQDTSYANVRELPDMTGQKICVVDKDDTMIYQNEYKYDNERYWLKIIVESQNNLEGWISANLIESSIVDELNLQ